VATKSVDKCLNRIVFMPLNRVGSDSEPVSGLFRKSSGSNRIGIHNTALTHRSVRPGEGEGLPLRRGHKGAVPGARAGDQTLSQVGARRQHRYCTHLPPHCRITGFTF
jgi:hypothetical protein